MSSPLQDAADQEANVDDCFWNFTIKRLASWFGINEPVTPEFLRSVGIDIGEVFDEDLCRYRPVGDADVV